MSCLVWTIPARQDIDDIYVYIAHSDGRPLTADIFVSELVLRCESYAEAFAASHLIGTPRSDLGEQIRVFSHKRWVVVFRPIENGIEVLRVVDGSRDFSRLVSVHGICMVLAV